MSMAVCLAKNFFTRRPASALAHRCRWTFWRQPFAKVIRMTSRMPDDLKTTLGHRHQLLQYDLVGFDLDHTICKYKLESLFPLIHQLVTQFLIEKRGYPKELEEEFRPSLIQKGLVLDKKRGNILKIGSDYRILTARHGRVRLSHEQIEAIYGAEKVLHGLDDMIDEHVHGNHLNDNYYLFRDFFVTPCVQICLKLVDVVDQRNDSLVKAGGYNFWHDIYDGLCSIFEREKFHQKSSGFFNALQSDPNKFLEKCSPKFVNFLQFLRKNQTKVFLLTASNIDFVNFLANHCLGRDWTSHFDMILTFARKPSFFSATNRSFLKVNNYREHAAVSTLKFGEIYSQGNSADMMKFLKEHHQETPRLLYVGDSILDDVFVPNKFANWHTAAVVEELEEDQHEHFDTSEWGSFFGNSEVPTLFADLMTRHAILKIAHLDHLAVD